MSREIKFRAWYENVRRGRKVGDDIIWSKTSYYDYDPIIDNKGLCSVESGWDIQGHEDKNDYILEQYTGLKDKNGKEIYEGDIVSVYEFDKKSLREVYKYTTDIRWNNRSAMFWTGHAESLCDEITEDHYEVIGNIHENPELLGGEK